MYRFKMGHGLSLKNPQTFSEKLQWLKLYDRRPEYTTMVDKHASKFYVAQKIGEEYIIPTTGVWDCVEDIDWDSLPDRFVLKTTHDSGGVVVCHGKETLNKDLAKQKLSESLARDYYLSKREYQYKNVPRRIIAEQYLDPRPDADDIYDFKFFTFNGEPRVLLFCSERKNGTSKWDFYDMEMRRMNVSAVHHKTTNLQLNKIVSREVFEKMKEIARVLGKGIPFVSVDQYFIQGRIYWGELTLHSGAGFLRYEPEEFDIVLGRMLDLPQKTKK
ncbi:MAG: glycosyl transferase [Bacteroidales bacterium]|nr:glycosyl transferase [Bacteroidales bacterium]